MNETQRQVHSIQQSAQTDPRFNKSLEVEVTPEAKEFTNRVFKSLLPHFPAWRQSCPEPDDLGRLKNAWTKAIMRHELKTGKKLNVKAGLLACEESETDWLCSVGRFIKMCDQSDEILPLAQRALGLFNSAQKQIDSIGQMVVGKHAFNLKQLKAAETSKQFIELYLKYAEDNPINHLDAFAVEDMSTASYEERKRVTEREGRTDEENKARDKAGMENFLNQFGNIKSDKQVEQPKKKAKGIQKGSLKEFAKSSNSERDEKKRQLDMIKGRL